MAWHAYVYGGQISMQIVNVSVLNVFLMRNTQKILPNLQFQYGTFLQVDGK